MDGNPLWSLPSSPISPIHIPCSILNQNWWESSLKPSLPPNAYSLLNSYSKVDGDPLWSLPSPEYIFLIQFLFKIDENPLWSLVSFLFKSWWGSSLKPSLCQMHIPYSVLIHKLMEIPLWNRLSPQYISRIQFLSKSWWKSSLKPSLSPIYIPYSILIWIWWKSFLKPSLSPIQ